MDSQLQAHIEQLAALTTEALQAHPKAREVFAEFKYKLNLGHIRAAEKLDGSGRSIIGSSRAYY